MPMNINSFYSEWLKTGKIEPLAMPCLYIGQRGILSVDKRKYLFKVTTGNGTYDYKHIHYGGVMGSVWEKHAHTYSCHAPSCIGSLVERYNVKLDYELRPLVDALISIAATYSYVQEVIEYAKAMCNHLYQNMGTEPKLIDQYLLDDLDILPEAMLNDNLRALKEG